MLNFFKKPQFPTKLFIVASMAIFIMFIASLLMFKAVVRNGSGQNYSVNHRNAVKKSVFNDPFITKVPRLKDLIKKPIITDADPMLGEKNSKVNVVVYSDFKCAFCKEQEQTIKNLIAKNPKDVSLIWKDYPENSVKSASYQAALAARCAQEQGRFWEYHDLLFKNSSDQSNDLFSRLAAEINLNLADFNSCLSEKKTAKLVDNDIAEADALEITGVPFIYANDKEIMGQAGLEELEEMVKNELK